ncbi:B3 domain-containing protein REM16-like [Cornus florida]|uniref:B3 domain-containing protein REM16-like n=1 Tax=Cornus florida TaxID=4283 RepID=UPI00289ADDA3|nr:B3 domain-containing protein REM16-like [Cornus florida]
MKFGHSAQRVNENTWKTKFNTRKHGGVLAGGWKNFALRNGLEEFDACLFELDKGTNDNVVLEVRIFRVVEDITPPTILNSVRIEEIYAINDNEDMEPLNPVDDANEEDGDDEEFNDDFMDIILRFTIRFYDSDSTKPKTILRRIPILTTLMGEEGTECRSWEENIYWTHFQCVQFFQILSGHFHHQLAVPKKVSNNLKLKRPETIDLKGPSGTTWNVGLTLDGDTLLFKHGWQKFVEDHSLEEGDILIFKYYGGGHFDVLMFDRRSFCEKEASYFVRNCGREVREQCQRKKNITNNSVEVALDSSHDDNDDDVDDDDDDDVGGNSSKKKRKVDDFLVPTSSRWHSRGKGTSRAQKGATHIKLLQRKKTLRNRERSTCAEGEKVNYGEFLQILISKEYATQRPISRNLARSVKLVSNRRPITEEEKEKALKMAAFAASTKDSFVLVMRPSHVYKSFVMFFFLEFEWAFVNLDSVFVMALQTVPTAWATRHLRPENQDVTLRVKENTWQTRFYFRKYGGVLGSGWKDFAIENSLEEFDVCLFDLASEKNEAVVLDVSIFRVVEDIHLPTILTSPSSRHRRPSKYARGKLIKGTGA